MPAGGSSTLALTRPIGSISLLLTDKRYFWTLAALVLLGDAVLTQLVIRFVSYTEIDFTTYLYHIDVYLDGERDYSLITGPSGPLVYPAGHVLVHRFLHLVTQGGKRMALAQQIYGLLYVVSQLLAITLYSMAGDVPNYVLLVLPLSKRLHSIYVLRMFNDCWAIPMVMASIALFAKGRRTPASVLFSAALSVKMNILLYLPGLLVILVKSAGLLQTIYCLSLMAGFQLLVAVPFLQDGPHASAYASNAFELSRVFLYKWTVNWRFVPESIFLSRPFSTGLLVAHLAVLTAFGLIRWCQRDGGAFAVITKALRAPGKAAAAAPVSQSEVITVLLTSNLIGIIFARSLHYQFYSWYAQQLPLLAYRTRYPLVLKVLLLGVIEYSWNVFPSTSLSSGLLLFSNVAILLGIWFGYPLGTTVQDTKRTD
ncbi:mannosyltransferase [Clavulina sp. PMI_390]|nr:mannosyltransferase [Clavulina sp. PMI_390]